MQGKDLILDPTAIDFSSVVADGDAIRQVLPQRHEFEQLTAVVIDDPDRGLCVGYKDTGPDDFWTRGHMPGLPLMPGVLMCEAAAQLCTYQTQRHGLMQTDMVGFGGLDNVRFRGVVLPGNRLVIVTQRLALRPRAMIRSRFECFVGSDIVCEGEIRGVPLPIDLLREKSSAHRLNS